MASNSLISRRHVSRGTVAAGIASLVARDGVFAANKSGELKLPSRVASGDVTSNSADRRS